MALSHAGTANVNVFLAKSVAMHISHDRVQYMSYLLPLKNKGFRVSQKGNGRILIFDRLGSVLNKIEKRDFQNGSYTVIAAVATRCPY